VGALLGVVGGPPAADTPPSSAAVVPAGDLSQARAHWVTRDLLLWDLPGVAADWTVTLHHAADASLAIDASGITGGSSFTLRFDAAGVPTDVLERFPHLASYAAFRVPPDHLAEVCPILRGQVALSAFDEQGRAVAGTGVQLPGVLDDLFVYDGPLGPAFEGRSPVVRLWAPTAQQVRLQLYETSEPSAAPAAIVPMARDEATGVWVATVDARWRDKYYTFAVQVFTPATNRVEISSVTDPYSVSLSTNSRRSHLVDLADLALMPAGWHTSAKPPLDAPEDVTLYELHIRDFSAGDETVRPAWRGTYLAFTEPASNGVRHLEALAAAGLTHVHLLPSFDFATVDDDKATWKGPGELSGLPPDSEVPQARIAAVRHQDAFNWGYDPWHYNVPDGSYATDPDGATRVREFRAMVQALNRAGLRVVLDVVYNHTTAAGQHEKSVLDRIVPGYYHRLNADGAVETSTCCQNTASEHAMMEKLIVDSARLWATHYKVDGFRFDLMGHHLKRNMVRLRAALDALTPGRDGVDGRRILVYGEGWDFGEVARNARGTNATQVNMAGTGIGTFNDRLRDAARGGGAFTGLQEQGFLTGLWTDPNALEQGSADAQRDRLLDHQDRIKVGLAGNLRDITIVDRTGQRLRGDAVDYNGAATGCAADPQETINYVEAHDNETLWDAIQLKAAPGTGVAERVRMQMLGLSLVALGQGIPFFHAGGELLRSKSLDRNSFDSGDWFNRLDFSCSSNNWGVGLPPASENEAHWPVFRPLLADPALRVGEAHIRQALAHLREMLAIRRSSRLFRLRTAQEVAAHLRFLNEGPEQVPGVIVVELSDNAGEFDPRWRRIVVVFNARPAPVSWTDSSLAGLSLRLHPVQEASADRVVRGASFDAARGAHVPGRTAAVFVERR
jgi:pullulanase-type alpha-1,6-glucosidase